MPTKQKRPKGQPRKRNPRTPPQWVGSVTVREHTVDLGGDTAYATTLVYTRNTRDLLKRYSDEFEVAASDEQRAAVALRFVGEVSPTLWPMATWLFDEILRWRLGCLFKPQVRAYLKQVTTAMSRTCAGDPKVKATRLAVRNRERAVTLEFDPVDLAKMREGLNKCCQQTKNLWKWCRKHNRPLPALELYLKNSERVPAGAPLVTAGFYQLLEEWLSWGPLPGSSRIEPLTALGFLEKLCQGNASSAVHKCRYIYLSQR